MPDLVTLPKEIVLLVLKCVHAGPSAVQTYRAMLRVNRRWNETLRSLPRHPFHDDVRGFDPIIAATRASCPTSFSIGAIRTLETAMLMYVDHVFFTARRFQEYRRRGRGPDCLHREDIAMAVRAISGWSAGPPPPLSPPSARPVAEPVAE